MDKLVIDIIPVGGAAAEDGAHEDLLKSMITRDYKDKLEEAANKPKQRRKTSTLANVYGERSTFGIIISSAKNRISLTC